MRGKKKGGGGVCGGEPNETKQNSDDGIGIAQIFFYFYLFFWLFSALRQTDRQYIHVPTCHFARNRDRGAGQRTADSNGCRWLRGEGGGLSIYLSILSVCVCTYSFHDHKHENFDRLAGWIDRWMDELHAVSRAQTHELGPRSLAPVCCYFLFLSFFFSREGGEGFEFTCLSVFSCSSRRRRRGLADGKVKCIRSGGLIGVAAVVCSG